MSFKVIGLCGGSGSGKGAASAFFSKRGYLAIDTDMVYRELTEKRSACLDALVSEFGEKILNLEGGLDRKSLGAIVFSDKEKLNRLNLITHKFILDEVRRRIEKARIGGFCGALVDAPLLYESGFDKECDAVVLMIADLEVRIARIIERDGISRDAAIMRINSQKKDDELLPIVDFVIENNGERERLDRQVSDIISKIT